MTMMSSLLAEQQALYQLLIETATRPAAICQHLAEIAVTSKPVLASTVSVRKRVMMTYLPPLQQLLARLMTLSMELLFVYWVRLQQKFLKKPSVLYCCLLTGKYWLIKQVEELHLLLKTALMTTLDRLMTWRVSEERSRSSTSLYSHLPLQQLVNLFARLMQSLQLM